MTKRLTMEGARKWELYFCHTRTSTSDTHTDHEDVMNLQLRNIDHAVKLAARTKDYPEGSKFKWNVETMWPVNEYLERYRNIAQADAFKSAVKDGSVALNASIGNILTGLCKQEEIICTCSTMRIVLERILACRFAPSCCRMYRVCRGEWLRPCLKTE